MARANDEVEALLQEYADLLSISGGDAFRVRTYEKAGMLYHDLHIASVEELADAIHDGRLKGLKGFGEKTEENILRGIDLMQQSGTRVLLSVAMDLAEEIVAELSAVRGCRTCGYAGSLRRMAETIGDIDILVASAKPEPVMDAFTGLSYVDRVMARGDTKTSIRTTKGLQVDLR